MEELTNWQRWQSYTSGLPSPQSYIDWSWLYTVSAALQRRVWLGPTHQPCFPNMYVILVGQPGIGKGLVIREVSDLLKHWKLEDIAKESIAVGKTQQDKDLAESVVSVDQKNAQDAEYQGRGKGQELIKPNLIPMCADAITYEALVDAVASSYRRINYINPLTGKLAVYGHSSQCFVLQELASLLRKHTNDTINYLLGLYDCPLDYEYVTKTKGKDRVRRGCLNLLAGTTPSFMQSTFDDKLIDEGFASRTFYICAQRNRKNVRIIPPLTKEQEAHKVHLLSHLKNLTMLYGNVEEDPETTEWMDNWWNQYENDRSLRSNKSLKMVPYYSRKQIHVNKVAMAMHYSESVTMKISLKTYQRAIAFLEPHEQLMHIALTMDGNNPQAKCARKILELLNTGPKNFVDIHIDTHPIIDRKGLEETLSFLELTEQVVRMVVHDTDLDKDTVYYQLPKGTNTNDNTGAIVGV